MKFALKNDHKEYSFQDFQLDFKFHLLENIRNFIDSMNTYLVTATFKNVALMGAAYDLFLQIIEEGTLNDEFEGFKVIGRYHASYSNNVYIIAQASAGIKMTEHFAPWKVKFDIDFDIKPVMTDQEKIAEHKLVGSLMASEQKMGFAG